MRIPNRYLPAPKEEIKPEKVVKPVAAEPVRDDAILLGQIKKMLSVKKTAPKYIFSMIRDNDGLLTQVVATPVDSDTIL